MYLKKSRATKKYLSTDIPLKKSMLFVDFFFFTKSVKFRLKTNLTQHRKDNLWRFVLRAVIDLFIQASFQLKEYPLCHWFLDLQTKSDV